MYLSTEVKYNLLQSGWVPNVATFDIYLYFQLGNSNGRPDDHSRYPEFTCRDGGMAEAGDETLHKKAHWHKIGAMQIEEDDRERTQVSTIKMDQLYPEANERIKHQALIDKMNRSICTQLTSGGCINKKFEIRDDLLCWKNRIYVPDGIPTWIMQSE